MATGRGARSTSRRTFGNTLAVALWSQVLKEPPPYHLTDFGLVISYQVLCHTPHDFGDSLLPLEIPIGHLHLAAGQADDRRSLGGSSHGYSEILEKRIEGLSQLPMAIGEVEHFVKEEEYGPTSRREESTKGFCPRGCSRGCRAKRLHPSGLSKLACQIKPRCLAASLRVPGVAHEHPYPGLRYRREPGCLKQPGNTWKCRCLDTGPGDVVERRQGVSLAATKLGDEREHRCGVARFARQPS